MVEWMTPWPKRASCWPSSTLRKTKKTRTTPKTCLCTHAGTVTGATPCRADESAVDHQEISDLTFN